MEGCVFLQTGRRSLRRVLIVHNHLAPVGGVEAHVESEIQLLSNAGYDVEVFAISASPAWKHRQKTTVYWQHPPSWRVRRILAYGFDPRLAFKLRQTVRRFRPDWIHLHTVEQPLTIFTALAGERVLHSVHINALACPLSTLYYRDTLEACNGQPGWKCARRTCVHPLSLWLRIAFIRCYRALINLTGTTCAPPNSSLALLLRQAGVRRVRVLPLFPHRLVSAGDEHTSVRSDNMILFVGALTDIKAPDLLINALPLIRESVPTAHIVFVGDGPLRNALVGLADRLGVAKHVRFLGRLDRIEVENYYRQAAVCVIPSIVAETFCLVAYEAMLHSCPVVSSNRGALPDIVQDGHTGLLFDPTDIASLSKAVTEVLTNPRRAKTMAVNARERVVSEFSPKSFLFRLENILRDV
ncbi:MAG: hypothetical protein KatS3mg060_0402 [Dehalococcoidia bacterium]|nr:MAG: hypothetical protein KatS3mg060_0402 [Dehalococcoidia bacterium]